MYHRCVKYHWINSQANPTDNACSERYHGTFKNSIECTFLEGDNKGLTFKQLINKTESDEFTIPQLNKLIQQTVNIYNKEMIHRTLQTTPEVINDALDFAQDKIEKPEIIGVRNNDTSIIEDRILIQEYKNKALELHQQALRLKDSDIELTPKEEFILNQTQKMIQNEAFKLAKLSQAQFEVINQTLDELKDTIDSFTISQPLVV